MSKSGGGGGGRAPDAASMNLRNFTTPAAPSPSEFQSRMAQRLAAQPRPGGFVPREVPAAGHHFARY